MAFCDLTDILLAGTIDVLVTRRPAGNYGADGHYDSAADSILTIRVRAQPATPREMEQLPEARRSTQTIALWSGVALFTTTENGQQADVVQYQSEDYEVAKVEDWSRQGGFWKSLATRLEA